MKRVILVIAFALMVGLAGFGVGAYTMYLKTEPVLFAWIKSAHDWQHQAETNEMAADYYYQNATLSIYAAEILKNQCDNLTAENELIRARLDKVLREYNMALNPGWEIVR